MPAGTWQAWQASLFEAGPPGTLDRQPSTQELGVLSTNCCQRAKAHSYAPRCLRAHVQTRCLLLQLTAHTVPSVMVRPTTNHVSQRMGIPRPQLSIRGSILQGPGH